MLRPIHQALGGFFISHLQQTFSPLQMVSPLQQKFSSWLSAKLRLGEQGGRGGVTVSISFPVREWKDSQRCQVSQKGKRRHSSKGCWNNWVFVFMKEENERERERNQYLAHTLS